MRKRASLCSCDVFLYFISQEAQISFRFFHFSLFPQAFRADLCLCLCWPVRVSGGKYGITPAALMYRHRHSQGHDQAAVKYQLIWAELWSLLTKRTHRRWYLWDIGLTILRLKKTCLLQQNLVIHCLGLLHFTDFMKIYNVDMELWPNVVLLLLDCWDFFVIFHVCVCVCVWLPFWCHPACGSLVKAPHGRRGTAGSSGLPEVSNQTPPCRSRTPAPSTWSYLEMDGWGHTHGSQLVTHPGGWNPPSCLINTHCHTGWGREGWSFKDSGITAFTSTTVITQHPLSFDLTALKILVDYSARDIWTHILLPVQQKSAAHRHLCRADLSFIWQWY